MFKKSKHVKESANKKRLNILLSCLLIICLVFAGTVLGKYIVDKTIGDKIHLTIAGTPQGNVLIGEGGYDSLDEYNENYEFVPTAGFAYQIQQLMETNSKTLGDVTKIVFDTEVPSGIDKANTDTKIDVSHGASGRIYAYYNSDVNANTVYVVPEELPTDSISYPMMAHENAAAMFAGLYNLETIDGLYNVYLDNITDSNNMFLDCRALTAVDLSHWTAEKLTDMHYMFAYCQSLKSLDLTSFHTVSVEDMNSLFWECAALETIEIDTKKFVTDKVVDMSDMFGNCNSLKAIDVSGFNTKNVIDMNGMFSGCQSLETLDVSGFDTSSAESIYGMFQSCYLLETIDVSSFDIDMVTNLSDMFSDCYALKSLDLSNWDTSNVTTMWRMFSHCESLVKLDLSTFNTGKVEDMSEMFADCYSLKKLYLTGWNTENVTNMYDMFYYCYDLEKLDLSSFNTANVTTMRYMFAYCGSLQTIYVSEKWSTEKVINTEDDGDPDYINEFEGAENELFTECWALVGGQGTAYSDIADEYSENYDADNYDDKKYAVIDKAQELQQDGTYGEKGYLTLYEAYTLTDGMSFSTAMLAYFDATTVTFGSYDMLKGTIGDIWNDASVPYEIVDDKGEGTIRAYPITDEYGTGIYVVSKDNSVIFANQDCNSMFCGMIALTGIYGLEDVDTRNTTDMGWMFQDCFELTDLDVSGFDTGKVTDMSSMFGGCVNLSWLDVSNFDTGNVTNMYGMFAKCPMYSLDVSGFDTGKVTNMGSMFASCTNLYELDLSKWNTENVTNMASMFDDCTSLETIYAGAGWNTDKVTSHNLMFDNCTALVGGQGTAFDSNYIDKTYALIDAAREPNGAKGYLTDADYGTKSKILLPGGEFNASLAALLTANEAVTKVQFGEANQFSSEDLGFEIYDETAWAENAVAVLDVARSGNISAFVVGDTVYILAKEVDYDDQYNSVIYANADSANMFRHNVGDETAYIPSGRLTAIDGLYIVDTGNTTNMSYMFAGSSNLATVDLKNFNTAGVTNMSYMFSGCNSIGGLSLSGFDTGKVTNMASMFYDCDAITALKLSDWNVSEVTNMSAMFSGCDKLNTLNLTGWNTISVTDMTNMFSDCSALKTIYVDESWKTVRVTESNDMFSNCTALVGGQGTTMSDTGNIDDKTYAVIDRYETNGTRGYLTYEEAYTLISGPDFNWMLWDGDGKDEYYGLSDSTIEWEGFDGGDVRITKIVFGSFDEYKDTLGLTSWDDLAPGLALDAEQEGNIRLYIPDFDWSDTQGTSNDKQTYYVLSKGSSKIIANEDCSGLLRSGPGWEDAYGLPWYIHDRHLEVIEGLDKLDTRYVTDMSMMFEYFAGESLDLSGFDTSNVTNMSYMFNYCDYLASIDVTGFDTSSVTDMSGMFHYCSALETIDVSKFETGKVTDMSSMFYSMSGLTSLNVSSFDTSKVTDMSNMFAYIYADKLDISNFSTAGYPYIHGMFYGCMNTELGKQLTTIYATDSWDPDKVRVDEYGYSVFGGSEALVGGEGSTYAETAATDSDNDYKYARIDEKVSSGGVTLGLFTDKNAPPTGDFTLKRGQSFNSAVSSLISSSSATKIQFGSWAEYGKANSFDWYGDTSAVTLDVNDEGTIKAFTKGDTVYILSGGNMYANSNCYGMFSHMSTLTEINGLSYVDTSNVTNMSYMFDECSNLVTLDVSAFNTSNVTTMKMMFYGTGLTSLDLSSFNTFNVTNMEDMFADSNYLRSLILSSFNTSNVENMYGMFRWCHALTEINVENFDTKQVTDMSRMFEECKSLTSLDVGNFNTANVDTMQQMFSDCEGLTALDLSTFKTGNVTNMGWMFSGCSKLQTLDLGSFDTSQVTSMRSMFAYCPELLELDLSSFNTVNVTEMQQMFIDSEKLAKIYVSKDWTTENVTDNGDFMFRNNDALAGGMGTTLAMVYATDTTEYINVKYAHIDGGDANPGYLTDINPIPTGDFTLKTGTDFNGVVSSLIANNSNLTKIQFGSWADYGAANGFAWTDTTATVLDAEDAGTIKAFTSGNTIYILSGGNMYANEDSSHMFQHNRADAEDPYKTGYIEQGRLTAIKGLENVDTSRVTNMSSMFMFCTSLTELNVSSFDTSKVTDMSYMFRDCETLTTLDVSKFDTSSVENMQEMFRYIAKVTTMDLSSFDTSKVTNMQGLFQDCDGLTSITGLGSYSTASVQNMSYMFKGCDKLSSLTFGDNFKTAAVTTMQAMFQECSGLTSLNLSQFVTTNVTTMNSMFQDCTGLMSLDVSSFDTSNVTDMTNLFRNLLGLSTLDVSHLDTSSVTTMKQMFWDLQNVTVLDLSGWDTSSVTTMDGMFGDCANLTTIYVSDKWSTASISNTSEPVFNGNGQEPTKLVGGAGTKWNSSYKTVARAKIDGGTANPGYLTTAPVTLTTGSKFNTAVENLFSENVTKLQFGKYSVVTASNSTLATAWNNSKNFVDVDGLGTIRVFTSGDTVYVLSNGNSEIYANASCSSMFCGDSYAATNSNNASMIDDYLTEIIGLEMVNTSNVTDMWGMFYYCKVLTSVDVSKFDTSNVTSMSQMFLYCYKVTELDVSGWDVSKVTNMSWMFGYCYEVTELDVSNWKTENVRYMNNTFRNCRKVTTLDVSDFNTKKVTTMYAMFQDCQALNTLDVSRWDTSGVTDMMSYMFYNCYNLKELDVSNWNTSNVKNMSYMFYNCYNLEKLDVSGFDTSNVANMAHMFYYCQKLTTLDVSNWNTSNVTNMANMFYYCQKLTALDVSKWSTSKVTSMERMFEYCTSLKTLDVSGFDVSGITYTSATGGASLRFMFRYCTSLEKLDCSNWDVSGSVSLQSIFSHCESLKTLNVSGWNLDGITDLDWLFSYCTSLTELDLSSWDISTVTRFQNTFTGSSSLKTIYVSSTTWTVDSTDTTVGMFEGCTSLVGGEGTPYNASYVTGTYARIDKVITNGTPGYLTTSDTYELDQNVFSVVVRNTYNNPTKIVFGPYGAYAGTFAWSAGTYFDGHEEDPQKVKHFSDSSGTVYILSLGKIHLTSMESMFHQFTNLKEIVGLGELDTSDVTSLESCFYLCTSLKSLDLSGLDTSNVTSMQNMFYECTALESVNLSGFDTSKVTTFDAMFINCTSLKYLDLSSFKVENGQSVGLMFNGCTALEKIVANDWNCDGNNVFTDCSKLVGGSNTAYNDYNDSSEYARIDDPDNGKPGYFTDPAQIASASALSLDGADAAEADGGEQNAATAEPAADSTTEAILPDAQTKEESESEPDTDTPDAEDEEN